MKEIIFIRHGMTDALALEVMCGGDADLELNEAGISHTREMAHRISPVLDGIKHIFCSPLKRATKTAEIYNEHIKKEISVMEGLREWRLGQWEGVSWKKLPPLFEYEFTPPGGEARVDFRSRALETYEGILAKDGRNLVIGHGVFFYEISSLLLGKGHILGHADVAMIKEVNATKYNLTIRHKDDISFQ